MSIPPSTHTHTHTHTPAVSAHAVWSGCGHASGCDALPFYLSGRSGGGLGAQVKSPACLLPGVAAAHHQAKLHAQTKLLQPALGEGTAEGVSHPLLSCG